MGYLSDEDIFKNIKANMIANVYFLYGQEKYFLEQAFLQIRKKVLDKASESFNYNMVNGEKLDLSELEDMTDALPLMAEKRLIALRDVDVDKLSKGDWAKLLELLSNISDTTVFVLYQATIAVDMKKSSRYKKLAELFAKEGVTCEFKPKDMGTLKRRLCERAKKANLEMEMSTAEYLIDKCSNSYIQLINEVDKLISYVGEGEITKKHVDESAIKSIASSSFDLAKSVLSNNFDRAYTLLDELIFQRLEGVAIVAALTMSFSDIYRAKCGRIAAKSIDDIAEDFKYPKNRTFAVKNAMRDVTSFSIEHIRFCIQALYVADLQLKSSKLDNRLIMEQMLGKMLLMSINERVI